MIETLASPSICVIDEDERDYRPILDALNGLYLSCVHIKGDTTESLPPQPFKDLRLVFTDLYLASGPTGKDMASHTANIFRKVVSAETAPVIVVIWSKHAGEKVDDGTPEDDQQTEADLFKNALLEADPKYSGRLIFVEMAKTRGDDWVSELKGHIRKLLEGQESISALWVWEKLVKTSAYKVSKDLTDYSILSGSGNTLKGLKEILQLLTHAQKEGTNLTHEVAPHYLSAVLGQLLIDQLEHADGAEELSRHGRWLIEQCNSIEALSPSINSMLLTADIPNSPVPFLPGSVYLVTDNVELEKLIGSDQEKIKSSLSAKNSGQALHDWIASAEIVMLELSPGCDVDNGSRVSATLLVGLILPKSHFDNAKKADSIQKMPVFSLRKGMGSFGKQDVFLVYSSRNKVTLPSNNMPDWLQPWFRLRELPTASIRNWHASQASRVGYVSL